MGEERGEGDVVGEGESGQGVVRVEVVDGVFLL
jgi:hypothetical protein